MLRVDAITNSRTKPVCGSLNVNLPREPHTWSSVQPMTLTRKSYHRLILPQVISVGVLHLAKAVAMILAWVELHLAPVIIIRKRLQRLREQGWASFLGRRDSGIPGDVSLNLRLRFNCWPLYDILLCS
ncbi:hypothetical protein WG66_011012 [Moniliophthora roreri]|nr:hypothetical protein WG66_011012 [Moniliophthora roreri]